MKRLYGEEELMEIFSGAAEIEDVRVRTAYLDEVCLGKESLRQRIEELLTAESESGPPPEIRDCPEPGGTLGLGQRIGPYTLVKKLGEGGYGTVYMAKQERPLRRTVALKVIKLGMDTRQVIARFDAERQALAMMTHSGIAQVFDAGSTDSGRPYFVMELVQGVKVTHYCREKRLLLRQRLEIVIQICHAIQHAHEKGIIHRDLKPSNILVAERNGEPEVKIIDFGIAKATARRLTEETLSTGFESMIGTPTYMSPEQVSMPTVEIDHRSDIFSLGVLLYELLTGTTPHQGKELLAAGLEQIRQIIREKTPVRPSIKLGQLSATVAPDVACLSPLPSDLDWVVLKCLETDRERRYQSARALTEDLQNYLDNQPVRARPPSRLYELTKTWQRHKVAFGAAAVVAATLAVGTVVSVWKAAEATSAKNAAQRIAEARRRELYASQIGLAHLAWTDGDMERAQLLLKAQRPQHNQVDLRGFEWRYLWQLCQDESRQTLTTLPSPVRKLSLSLDQTHLAISTVDGVEIWDLVDHRKLGPLDGALGGGLLAFSPTTSDLLATAGPGRSITLWDVIRRQPVAALGQDISGRALCFSRDGGRLAVAIGRGPLVVWDIEREQQIGSLPGHPDGNLCVEFSPDGNLLASGGRDTQVRLWNANTGEPVSLPLTGHSAWVMSVAFSPDGRLLATAGLDDQILLWDLQTLTARPPLLGHNGGVLTMVFSPDGETLISGGGDHTIRLWNVASLRQERILRGHTKQLMTVKCSRDGQFLISAARDKTVKLWDLHPSQERLVLTKHAGWVESAALSPDGQFLASSDYHDLAIKLWEVQSGRLITNLLGHTGVARQVMFSPNGKLLASGGDDQTVRWWDATEFRALATNHCPFPVKCLSFSGDNTLLAAAGEGLKFWRVDSGQEVKWIQGDMSRTEFAAFSRRGGLFLTSNGDGNINVWKKADGTQTRSFRHEGARIIAACFSWNGHYLAVGTGNGEVAVFDVVNDRRLDGFQGHRGEVISVAFTPDDQTLASTGFDGTIRLWNIATGQAALMLRQTGPVTDVSFSDDGNRMATSGADATVRLWPAASLSQADAFFSH